MTYDRWASKFVGRCWHKFEWSDTDCYDVYYTCTKCGIEQVGNANFHPTLDDRDYLELVRYAMKHEKWRAFKEWLLSEQEKRMNDNLLHVEDAVFDQMFDRERGTKAIYEFFSKEGEK